MSQTWKNWRRKEGKEGSFEIEKWHQWEEIQNWQWKRHFFGIKPAQTAFGSLPMDSSRKITRNQKKIRPKRMPERWDMLSRSFPPSLLVSSLLLRFCIFQCGFYVFSCGFCVLSVPADYDHTLRFSTYSCGCRMNLRFYPTCCQARWAVQGWLIFILFLNWMNHCHACEWNRHRVSHTTVSQQWAEHHRHSPSPRFGNNNHMQSHILITLVPSS